MGSRKIKFKEVIDILIQAAFDKELDDQMKNAWAK